MFLCIKNSIFKNIVFGLIVVLFCMFFGGCQNTIVQTPNETPKPSFETKPTKPLFDEAYYAVLPGEGAYYHVYDCYGEIVGGFVNTEDSCVETVGLYPKETIQFHYNFATKHDINAGKENQYAFSVNVLEHCYWTYDCNVGQICVYNKEDDLLYMTTAYPEREEGYWFMASGVLEVSNGFLVYVCDGWEEGFPNQEEPVFVAWDGTVTTLQLPENLRLTGVLGNQYLIAKQMGETWDSSPYVICDYNGTVLVKDFIAIVPKVNSIHTEAALSGILSFHAKGYIYKGIIYGVDLQPLEEKVPDYFHEKDTSYFQYWDCKTYISDAVYHIGGVTYTATFNGTALFFIQDKTLNLIKENKQYRFSLNTELMEYCYINAISNGLLHLYGKENQYIFRFSDQSCIAQFEDVSVELADTWFAVRRYGEQTETNVYDENGSLRYTTKSNVVKITKGNYMVLQRGPYIGIADLDGNYIMKALLPDVGTDSAREEEIW